MSDTTPKSDTTLEEQAAQLEQLLPAMMRALFTLQPDHPATELPVAQLRVCSILQHGPRTMSAVSEELAISVSAMTQIADRMERAGLVERVAGQEDRRLKRLQLTEHGAAMMRSRRERRVCRAAEALAQLPEDQRELTLQVLHTLLEAGRATAPPIPHEDPIGVRQEQ